MWWGVHGFAISQLLLSDEQFALLACMYQPAAGVPNLPASDCKGLHRYAS